ncbi:DUF885 domain-containing protein [Lutimonas saemankumensis]|uniref:DUF885 domain-containing protein n=1 Tax=Lutimonas saemankumensis TaxID=483016 RepID=UPI001CD2EAF6|nr:DUF885 domain-containing protein [Lutimonas saemankumensis]MCA0931626.1 DUF885 domain-containing protein [Lutimonas saemankumensis]
MSQKVLILLIFTVLMVGCKKESNQNQIKNPGLVKAELKVLLEDYFSESMKLDPLAATSNGIHTYNDQFPDYLSKSYKDSVISFNKRYLKRAELIESRYLSQTDSVSKAVLIWKLKMELKRLEFRTELFPLDQLSGKNLLMGKFASGTSAQPFKTVEDYENWLKRLDGFVLWLSAAEQRMKEGASIRYILPSSLIIKVVPQLQAMTEENVEDHLFYAPVKNFPSSFSKEDKEHLKESYTTMLKDKLIPAFKTLHDYVSKVYLEAGRNSSGIDAIPNGKEFYDFAILNYTTTDLSAEEIHQMGLDEVARILAEMEKVKDEVGFEGSMTAFFDHIRTNEKLMPFTSADQVIQNFGRIHENMKPNLKKLFYEAPKTRFEVRRTEAFREASASAQYNQGSLEEDRPGIFYVPIPDASKYNTFYDESLFLHEAIPGHHYQIALTQENDSLPDFRKNLWFSAYGEGWALYAESLGKELGLYKDPYQYFGMLNAEMHRAIRLVVDTGLHSKGWTREQAIQYSMDHEALTEPRITSEVERYMARPGQALSYKIGQLKIIELRKRAEEELEDQFDLRSFHHEILKTGCITLSILEEQIEFWIKSQQLILENNKMLKQAN